MYGQYIVGGPYDDKIWTGNNTGDSGGNNGAGGFDVLVYGDNEDIGNYPAVGGSFPGADIGMPLVEDPKTFNKDDGGDIIDVGDDNFLVGVYGQGGNDKIIGGVGTN